MQRMFFGLGDSMARMGRMLYLPMTKVNDIGYFFVDGYGIPLGCVQVDDYLLKYWLGRSVSPYAFECGTLVIPEVNAWFTDLGKMAEVGLDFRLFGSTLISCTATYNLSVGCYSIDSIFGSRIEGQCYCISDAQLAKYYMLT